jgi:hypothetical protein
MEPRISQQARPAFHSPPADKQVFQQAHSSVGVIGTRGLLHLTRIGTALAPLVVLETIKEPVRQSRWIRIFALVGAGLSETLWAVREQQRREERRFEHYR